MGADFTYQYVPAAELTEEREKAALALIDDETDYDDGVFDTLQEWREALRSALEAYKAAFGRESAIIAFPAIPFSPTGERYYFLTGGMSWGDAPTKAYTHMSNLTECDELWELFAKWELEDQNR